MKTVIFSISLLLAVLALVVWSFASPSRAAFVLDWNRGWLESRTGNMSEVIERLRSVVDGRFDIPGFHVTKRHYDDPSVHRRIDGSEFRNFYWQVHMRVCSAWVSPLFLPLLLVSIKRLRTRSRRRSGRCLNCGYDLRASPGPCPECGRTTPLIGEGRESGSAR